MTPELLVFSLAAALGLLFWWAFRALPAEAWQILAAVPLTKEAGGAWKGLNFTYYGFFNATANTLSVAIIWFLTASIGTPVLGTLAVIVTLLVICLPAAGLIARVVERKRHTFTVGGACFVGILVLPGVIYAAN